MAQESPLATNWNRIVAYVMDAWVFVLAAAVGGTFGEWFEIIVTGVAPSADRLGMNFGFYFWGWAITFLNVGVLQGLTGSSLGKHAMGLRVVRKDGAPIGVRRSVLRSLGHFLAFFTLYASYAVALINKEKRAGHDWLAWTVVIKKGAIYPERARPKLALVEEQDRPSLPRAA